MSVRPVVARRPLLRRVEGVGEGEPHVGVAKGHVRVGLVGVGGVEAGGAGEGPGGVEVIGARGFRDTLGGGGGGSRWR